ncbi:hypothetical protein J2750_002467 [Methanococcoides alaskense]|uniref:Uncharacterized protein n=1 Tax=Methanococcoides alaskense TaxID=325778 RepID=A0AA90ZAR7_9EURY|nr:hypothetical protein [Methanococcoides alaskense]
MRDRIHPACISNRKVKPLIIRFKLKTTEYTKNALHLVVNHVTLRSITPMILMVKQMFPIQSIYEDKEKVNDLIRFIYLTVNY